MIYYYFYLTIVNNMTRILLIVIFSSFFLIKYVILLNINDEWICSDFCDLKDHILSLYIGYCYPTFSWDVSDI